MSDLSYLSSVILGVVEGLTEYLPISSTAHLTIAEKLLGLKVDAPEVTAYTAIIQLGAIAATVVYFFRDIVRLLAAWFRGLVDAEARREHDYALAWAVIVGSIPVAVVGFALRKVVAGPLRSRQPSFAGQQPIQIARDLRAAVRCHRYAIHPASRSTGISPSNRSGSQR